MILPMFSAETKEEIKNKKFATSIFQESQYKFANQILNIAICEG